MLADSVVRRNVGAKPKTEPTTDNGQEDTPAIETTTTTTPAGNEPEKVTALTLQ